MKKIAILLIAMFIAAGAVAAQEGLYFGAEFGVEDFSEAGDTMWTGAYVGYGIEVVENLELGIEVYAEIPFVEDATIGFSVEPSVQYTIPLDFGGLYFGVAMPIYLFGIGDFAPDPFDDEIGLNFTAGIELEAGFGFEATLYNYIKPESSWADYLDLYAFYGLDALSFGVCVGLPLYEDGFDYEGLTITPDVAYDITENLNIYAEFPIFGIGSDIIDVGVGFTLGVCYSF